MKFEFREMSSPSALTPSGLHSQSLRKVNIESQRARFVFPLSKGRKAPVHTALNSALALFLVNLGVILWYLVAYYFYSSFYRLR